MNTTAQDVDAFFPEHTCRDRLSVNLQTCRYEVLREVSKQLGYVEADATEDNWDLCWSDLSVSLERVAKLKPFQRLNHFPSMLEICRKTQLSRHMSRMAARLPDEYDFHPVSLNLPDQLDDLIALLKRNKTRLEQGMEGVQTFIIKPSSGTMGRGIHLVQTVGQLSEVDISNCIAQAYIPNPLLLDGFKFDLRIYAMVLSVDPLKIYLYDEGLARLCTVPYQAPTDKNIGTSTMHLTNYSVNKRSQGFVEDEVGTKRPASSVLQAIADRRGVPLSRIVGDISAIINKTVISIQPMLSHTYHTAISSGGRDASSQRASCPCMSLDHASSSDAMCTCPASQCFEVLGFDIMLDDTLKPWLIEVNHSPSFGCDAKLDQQVKSSLISDTISALSQDCEERLSYFDAQHKAQSERLYCPHPNPNLRRPLSCVPRSRQLRATSQALDDILMSSSPPRNSPSCLPRSESHSHGGSGKPRRPSLLQQQQLSEAESILGAGFMGCNHPRGGPQTLGRYNQIYPSPVERSRYLKIMATASDAFSDQRCGCAWCARRLRVRHMASTALEIFNATGNMRHRPYSASPSIGGGANGIRPNSAVRSLSQMGLRSESTSSPTPKDTIPPVQQPSECTGVPITSTPPTSSGTPKKPPRPYTTSGSPLVFTPPAALSSGSGGESSTSSSPCRGNREPPTPAVATSADPGDTGGPTSPSSKPLIDLSSKIDRHLARYLKALHSSSSRYRGAVTSPSADLGGGNGGGDPPSPASTSSVTSSGYPVSSGHPPRPASAPRSLVPRVARLASARSASQRMPPPGMSGMDQELMAMRVTTAAMLSNSFVSCYASALDRGEGRSRLGSAAVKRAGSARPSRG